ncbi:enoyl-CoA hydratase/isomerase family protein [bacterium]|nr:enoyl-CoA hydratase/isomerase family protein [bacterium]
MSDKKCSYAVSDGIAIMTIDNPPVNALSAPVLKDIENAVRQALDDDAVRVVILTGAGDKAFIAGADITEFTDLKEKELATEFLSYGQGLTNLIEESDKPFIAAINGFCLGGGMEYALACHIRLANEDALLGLPEIKLGIIPGYGGTQRTPRLIGKGRALELILSGNFISGTQAAEYGLVNRAVPAGTVLEEASKLAKTIATKSRMNVKAALKAVNEGMELGFKEGLALEGKLFGDLCETADKTEGVTAFIEKRNPEFQDK